MRPSLLLVIAWASIAACSSTETADEEGDSGTSDASGSGGAGASTGAGASASSASGSSGEGGGAVSSGSTMGTGGVGGAQICADLCAHATALGCPTARDCEGDCEAGFANAGECADELEAFLACVAYESTTCEDFEMAPRPCQRPAQLLVECTGR